MITPRLPAGGRTKPPRGMAVINRLNPVGNLVSACWLFNEGAGGRITDLVSGVSTPITMHATESSRAKWNGSPDGIPCLDLNTTSGNYANCTGLRRTVYSRGISFLGLFRYPTAGGTSSNRCLIMTRSDGLNGLMWTFGSATLTISTKGWGGWAQDTQLTPDREKVIALAGTQAPNGDVRIWMNGKRYSTNQTWSTPTISDWYIGVDSFDTSRQWCGPVYMAAVLHGSLSWGQMEAWARSPFAFVTPHPPKRSTKAPNTVFTATVGLTAGKAALAASATFTKPSYTSSAALLAGHAALAATSKFTKPSYTASATFAAGSIAFAASATFTKPTYSAVASLAAAPAVLAASSTFTKPSFTAAASFTCGPAALAAAATFSKPVYSAAVSLNAAGATLSAAATFAKPTYAAVATLTVGPATFAALVDFNKPAYTASAALAAGPASLASIASFAKPVYSASVALAAPPAVLAAAVTTSNVSFTAAVVLVSGGASLAASAIFSGSVRTAAVSLVAGPAELHALIPLFVPDYVVSGTWSLAGNPVSVWLLPSVPRST